MTRKERHDRLKEIWKKMPLNDYGFSDEKNFFAWQGMAAALLSFNSQLQAEFRDTIKNIPTRRTSFGLKEYKPVCDRIFAVLSEAINELSIPEEPAIPAVVSVLTDEHGIWWFLGHCTFKTRWTLVGVLVGGALTMFGVGFKLGTIDLVKNLYREYMSLPTPAPTAAPSASQPAK